MSAAAQPPSPYPQSMPLYPKSQELPTSPEAKEMYIKNVKKKTVRKLTHSFLYYLHDV